MVLAKILKPALLDVVALHDALIGFLAEALQDAAARSWSISA